MALQSPLKSFQKAFKGLSRIDNSVLKAFKSIFEPVFKGLLKAF
jgi:hypothetical protein